MKFTDYYYNLGYETAMNKEAGLWNLLKKTVAIENPRDYVKRTRKLKDEFMGWNNSYAGQMQNAKLEKRLEALDNSLLGRITKAHDDVFDKLPSPDAMIAKGVKKGKSQLDKAFNNPFIKNIRKHNT